MAKTPESSMVLDSLVEIIVPTLCRCREPLPDNCLTEVLDETKAKMSAWFGGGSVRLVNSERMEGFFRSFEDGSIVDEPVYLVFSNTDAVTIDERRDEVMAYAAGMANRLTQEAIALRINGKMYQFPSTGYPKPHRCGGGSAVARISDPRDADKNTRMRFLQASLQRVNSLNGIRDVFCNHLHYEFSDETMPTSRWPDALKQFLVPGTAPQVVADQNGFRIIYLQLADNCLRKGQERQLIQRLIKDDPALRGLVVVSDVDQKQWNLINVKLGREQESGTNKERMLLRRMRVGPGQPVRTAVERLIEVDVELLGEDKDAAAIQDAHDKAFDVDAVTKQFFTEIAGWYFWALPQVEFPNDTNEPDEKVRATSLIRMLTRIIFCWFLREKKLVPSNLFDQREVAKILNDLKPDSSSYYQGTLQNLFFATLNQRMGKDKHGRSYRAFARDEGFEKNRSTYGVDTLYRYEEHFRDPDKALGLFADIPFLNGGLFECLDRTNEETGAKIYIDGFSRNKRKRAKVPNDLFFAEERTVDLSADFGDRGRRREKVRGLLRILHSYNFTIEENTPVDEEVALDPELLGKVFENLLASYNEETKKTARRQTGSFYTPRLIVDYMVDESLKAYFTRVLVEKTGMKETGVNDALDQLFSYDNESHQFSEAQVAALITAINEVKILDPACGSGAFPMGALHKLVHILRKLDRGNERWKQAQLAKLDSAEMREILEASFADNNDDYGRKLYLIENCLYGVDIQPIAIQITKLRFFISLVCDQKTNRSKKDNHGIRPLPNLETKFVAANTLIGLPELGQMELVDPRVYKIEADIETLYHSHFSEHRRDRKVANQRKVRGLRQELGKLLAESLMAPKKAQHIAEWDPFDPQATADFFDPHWMFGRSMAAGSDIVIGNPPYIKERDSKCVFDAVTRSAWGKQYHEGKMDYWFFFLHRALEIAKPNGVIAYITSRYWINSTGSKKLVKHIRQSASLFHVVDIGALPVFEQVAGHHMLHFYKVQEAQSPCLVKRLDNSLDDISLSVPTKSLFISRQSPQRLFNKSNEIRLYESKVSIVSTLSLGDVYTVSQGVVQNPDKVSSVMSRRYGLQRGRGVFVLERNEFERLKLNSKEAKFVKSFYDESSVAPFRLHRGNEKYLFYITQATCPTLESMPNVERHLTGFRKIMDARRETANGAIEWFQLHWPRAPRFFESEKVVLPSMFRTPSAAYVPEPAYFGLGSNVVIGGRSPFSLKVLCALLNSSAGTWWFINNGKLRGAGVDVGVGRLRQFPLPSNTAPFHVIESIVTLLVTILSNETQNDTSSLVPFTIDLIDACVLESYWFFVKFRGFSCC